MQRLRLGIDLDGVVADFVAGWISRYNQEFEADLSPLSVQTWDGLHTLTHFADSDEFWTWASDHGGSSVFRHLETYEGATAALDELAGQGHEIVIITLKPDWAVHDTFAWIADHRVPTREVHITANKWEVSCDIYLDDSPQQLMRYVQERPDRLVCRFVRPWNDPVEGVRDIAAWKDFVELATEFARRE
jgi:5'(3')-deoxyribonucleotidase